MSSPPKTWKSIETKVAKMFGSERTPLSGGNSKHTRSDTLHSKLFIEVKHRKGGFYCTNLFDKCVPLAETENKIPVVALHPKGSREIYFVVRARDIKQVAEELEG